MAQLVEMIDDLDPARRLDKDLRTAAKTLGQKETRFLVNLYYSLQERRKRTANQIRAIDASEPHEVIEWFRQRATNLENQIKIALDYWSLDDPMAFWARGTIGIGPVIATGLSAHIDIERAPTVGHIWRFAGLDPTVRWEKGKKRPWNADLKTLCWKIGESFVKVSGNERSFYGGVYKTRKEDETQRNEAGDFAEQARHALETKRISKTTEAYKYYSGGRLAPGHIHARAKRYAVKLFLAHWHETAWRQYHGTEPPLPYIIAFGDHAHHITASDARRYEMGD